MRFKLSVIIKRNHHKVLCVSLAGLLKGDNLGVYGCSEKFEYGAH